MQIFRSRFLRACVERAACCSRSSNYNAQNRVKRPAPKKNYNTAPYTERFRSQALHVGGLYSARPIWRACWRYSNDPYHSLLTKLTRGPGLPCQPNCRSFFLINRARHPSPFRLRAGATEQAQDAGALVWTRREGFGFVSAGDGGARWVSARLSVCRWPPRRVRAAHVPRFPLEQPARYSLTSLVLCSSTRFWCVYGSVRCSIGGSMFLLVCCLPRWWFPGESTCQVVVWGALRRPFGRGKCSARMDEEMFDQFTRSCSPHRKEKNGNK
jgi:hypothetical protein